MVAPLPFFSDRGSSVRILEEVKALQRAGHEALVCTYRDGRDIPGISISRIGISLPGWKEKSTGSLIFRSFSKLILDVFLTFHAVAVFRRWRPHCIHTHIDDGALIGALLRRISGVPTVYDCQGSLSLHLKENQYFNRKSITYLFFRSLERMVYSVSPMILVSASQTGEFIQREFGIPGDRIQMLPDRVDTAFFHAMERPEELRRELGIPEKAKVAIYLGVLSPHQGSHLLLDLIRKVVCEVPEAHFLIIGYPDIQGYCQEAEQLGVSNHVTFLDGIPYSEAPRYLSLGHVALSLKVSSTGGNSKVLNYMSVGLPVVLFDSQSNREIAGDLARYVPMGDTDRFADEVIGLLRSPETSKALGRKARQWVVQHFEWDRGTPDLLRAYRKAGAF